MFVTPGNKSYSIKMIIWGEDEKKEGWGFKIKTEHHLQRLQAVHKKKEAYWHFRKKLSFKIRNVKLSDVLQMIASGLTKNVYMDGELFGVVGDELRECKFKNLATSSL